VTRRTVTGVNYVVVFWKLEKLEDEVTVWNATAKMKETNKDEESD
jgi:hypothetical protein